MRNNKGITLIALVITIIVLLLLAGISISMIAGQDGILTKASTAKQEMNKAELEEKIGLAVAEWELEKGSNSNYNVTLEEHLKSKTDIKSDEPLTWISGDNVVNIDSNNNLTVNNKSKNLMKNGYLENKNNDNFSKFIYNKDGYLSISTNFTNNFPRYVEACSDEYIPVDTSKKYRASLTAKTDNVANCSIWLGISEYDIDYKCINPEHYMYMPNTLTYLTQDLKDGDTEIHLNDISNFECYQGKYIFRNGLIVWNYKDSTGYQYEPLTYSRNVYIDLFDYNEDDSAIDKENNIIKLKKPCSRGTIKQGTQVSQSNDADTFNYLFYSTSFQEKWITKSRYIQGKTNDGTINVNRFRPGTKYTKFVYITEIYEAAENATAYFKDIVFEEVE